MLTTVGVGSVTLSEQDAVSRCYSERSGVSQESHIMTYCERAWWTTMSCEQERCNE